jgi:hypothetical protein
MNRIVLIGNGFDLAHGLPTRYEDFINDYWSKFFEEAKQQNNSCEKECVSIVVSDETLANILSFDKKQTYKAIQNCVDFYNKNTTSGRVQFEVTNKILHQISKINSLKTWVDIENEYYKFLCKKFDITVQDSYSAYDDVRKLNEDFNYVKEKLNEYLIKISENVGVNMYNKILKIIYSQFILKEFTTTGKEYFVESEFWKIKRKIEGTRDSFYDEMSPKTEPLLSEYKGFTENDYKHYLFLVLNNEKQAQQYFDLKPKGVLFLNFNYTDSEKLYFDDDNFESEVIHIHGELNNPSNPIIFGYGDELEDNYKKLENLQDNNYLENIKSIKYQETDNYKRLLSFVESDKYQVIILGHSCGNSDRTLLNTLFEHENCVSIKPYYYQYKEGGIIKDNYSDIVRNISRSFTDKKSMRDKVVNKTYTDCFSSCIE